MLNSMDIRTVIEVAATLTSAVAVVVTLKTDIKWLVKMFDAHATQDDARFASLQREVDQLKERMFSHQ